MIIIGVIGISLSSILVRYSNAPSVVTAAWRLTWTVVFLSPVVFLKKDTRCEIFKMTRKLALLSILSGLFLAAHFVLWFESLQHTTVASSTTIVCTEVIWVALGYVLFMKGKLSWLSVLAIVVCLFGSVLIAFSDSDKGSSLYGDILAILAAVAVAIYTLIGRYVRKFLTTTSYTYVVYVSCCAALVLSCCIQRYSMLSFGYSSVLVGALLAVVSTILGHSIFSWCLKYFSPAFVSASKLCEPVVAGVLAGFLFLEIPGWMQILGGVLVLSGVVFYSYIETKLSK